MKYKSGEVSIFMVLMIVFIVLFVAAGSVAVWSYLNYVEKRDNVDTIVAYEVAVARREQADELEADFIEREKQPNLVFSGPEEYGSLNFSYPRTWSVYEASTDASRNPGYQAFLHPIVVPSITDNQSRFALRVTISGSNIDTMMRNYSRGISDGTITSIALSSIGQQANVTGIRLDGAITRDIIGSLIMFGVRDRTIILQTDADAFRADFDAIISTITFVP
jgi:hypothetical protein